MMTNEQRADYYTSGRVGHHSVGLQMPEGSQMRANALAYFDARKLYGLDGYVDREVAPKILREKFPNDG